MADKSPPRHWASMNEFSFVAGMRLLFWICKVFGRWPFRIILYPVLAWYVATKSDARAASQNFLRHVNRASPIGTGILNVIQHFAAFAEMLLDKMLLWSDGFDFNQVEFIGLDLIQAVVDQKRGAVLICAHLGNIDLCRAMSAKHRDLKVTILVYTKHAKDFNEMLKAINPDSQMNLLQVTEMNAGTAMMLATRVAQGEIVVIAGDRIPVASNPRVAMVNFLGEIAPFPIGPYVLASVLQCPTFMIFALSRQGPLQQRYDIHFKLLRESIRLPRKGRDQALTELAAEYAAQLEHHVLKDPLQWFNFYDYWHLPDWKTPHVTDQSNNPIKSATITNDTATSITGNTNHHG